MRFEIGTSTEGLAYEVSYHEPSLGFVTAPDIDIDFAICTYSQYLELDFTLFDMKARALSGYCPKVTWAERRLSLPRNMEGSVHVSDVNSPISRGDAFYYVDDWVIFYDSSSRIVRAGDYYGYSDDAECVRFLKNCYASIANGELKAIWVCL